MPNARHRAPDARQFMEQIEKPNRKRELQRYEKTHAYRKRIDSDGKPADGVERFHLEILSEIV